MHPEAFIREKFIRDILNAACRDASACVMPFAGEGLRRRTRRGTNIRARKEEQAMTMLCIDDGKPALHVASGLLEGERGRLFAALTGDEGIELSFAPPSARGSSAGGWRSVAGRRLARMMKEPKSASGAAVLDAVWLAVTMLGTAQAGAAAPRGGVLGRVQCIREHPEVASPSTRAEGMVMRERKRA